MKRAIILIISGISVICSHAADTMTGRFRSIVLPTGKVTSVLAIEQDPSGFIWMGTDDGLARYDGYAFKTYRWSRDDTASLANNIVNTLLYDNAGGCLYAGTDTGVSIYSPLTDSFMTMPGTQGRHIKSFLMHGTDLYICTTTGLLLAKNGCATVLTEGHFTSIRLLGDDIWAASYNAIYRIKGDNISRYDLSAYLPNKNTLVLDLCSDPDKAGALWIGTEYGLFHYLPSHGRVDGKRFANIPIKTFRYIGDELWIGSDNGLMIMSRDGTAASCRHKVGNSSSIPDNVVWCIFEDSARNIWIGTDHCAAIADTGERYKFIDLEYITHVDDGLDVSVMEADNYGHLWLGGPNGLICANAGLNGGTWIKAGTDTSLNELSHNKVRDLHDDGGTMWIVSDGGLDAYVHKTGKLRNCRITESTGRFSSNWMYSIAEDSGGRLWIGTYDGGLYGVSKEKILAGGNDVECDIHLSTESVPALSSNIVRHVAVKDNILYAEAYNVINIIRMDTREATRTQMPHDVFVVSMLPFRDGMYIGTDKGLYRIDNQGVLEKIPGSDIYVMAMAHYQGRIWMAGKSSISSYCPETGVWHHIPVNDLPLMSIEPFMDRLYFGTVDGIASYSPDAAAETPACCKVSLTSFHVNEEPIKVGQEYDGRVILDRNISFAENITLSPRQNSFAFTLSSFTYGNSDVRIKYRLKGFDDKWRELQSGDNSVSFINVPSGRYRFEYAAAESGEDLSSVNLRVLSVWYLTAVAYMVYALLFLCLCVWVFYYLRMKHLLSMEHKERERAIEMADSKTEFLSDISHEFKSPLSIILNYISRMTRAESDVLRSKELQTIQKNAEKMHLLLNRMVEFNENGSLTLFMPTAVSLGDVAKEVWNRYAQAFADKEISSRFVSDDIGYVFMVDKVQMESVFQNLLSNAVKFTPRGGGILMSVTISEETSDMVYVDIKVEDTGCGIAEEELPKIFNRHYMAPSGKFCNPGGSGIGLDIVKNIVEMHKGKIWVESEVGKGSCFTVRLSTMKSESFILKSAVDTDLSLHSLSSVWQHERKPIILIVEDNGDIRDFILASLGKDYVFLTADNGVKALALLKTEKVDLVITDIAMPEMDGLTMSRTIRNNLETAFLPIIVLTGKNDIQTQIQSFEYADAFIGKPFDLNYLNGRIIKLLIKHEQYLSKIRQQKMLLPETEELRSPDEVFLNEIIRIINRHIDDSDFSVAMLCGESHWSDKQVYRKIKQLTGKTVTEFIRDLRLEKAAGYLMQGKLTVNEVMYKVGFTTASYFSKCFREKYSVTPTEYMSGH